MIPNIKKPGRPKVDENREFLHTVSFKADKTTREAIATLKAAVIAEGGSVSGAASIAIRRALVAAAAEAHVCEQAHAREPGDAPKPSK